MDFVMAHAMPPAFPLSLAGSALLSVESGSFSLGSMLSFPMLPTPPLDDVVSSSSQPPALRLDQVSHLTGSHDSIMHEGGLPARLFRNDFSPQKYEEQARMPAPHSPSLFLIPHFLTQRLQDV